MKIGNLVKINRGTKDILGDRLEMIEYEHEYMITNIFDNVCELRCLQKPSLVLNFYSCYLKKIN